MRLLKKANAEFWKRVKTDQAYAPLIDRVKEVYRENCTLPPPPLSARERALFALNGSRIEFETAYFARRRALTASALLSLVCPEEPRYLLQTQELLFKVAEEYAWALPAHTLGLSEEEERTFIDLFAAETGLQVTEISYLLGDRLSAELRRRVKDEVEKRVLFPFCKRAFWWESSESNWSAVCAGNVGACFCYLAPERFGEIFPRIMRALDCFLSSYPSDGTCLEGFTYWHYGFGEYVWFADLLYEFTDGKTDLLANEKAEKIAGYAERCFLAGNASVSFSDGERAAKAETGLMHYLAKRFPKMRPLPEGLTAMPVGNLGWHKLSRLFLSFDPALKAARLPRKDYFLRDAGQAIFNRGKYSLAVKAGHNDEPHNHNDVGSFILATERGQVICDIGAGLYTKQYFSPDGRYSILCNSSRGHSVPIVNGEYQRAGKEYFGTIDCEKNAVTLEIAAAYGQKDLARLTRRFECLQGAVRLTDGFSPDYTSFTERFPLLAEPKLFDGFVVVENVKISFDKRVASPLLSKEEHALHAPAAEVKTETIYLLDFAVSENQTSVSFLFEII